MNQRPANVQMGLAQSGKGLVMVSEMAIYILYLKGSNCKNPI